MLVDDINWKLTWTWFHVTILSLSDVLVNVFTAVIGAFIQGLFLSKILMEFVIHGYYLI
jgi:VanZ family protein